MKDSNKKREGRDTNHARPVEFMGVWGRSSKGRKKGLRREGRKICNDNMGDCKCYVFHWGKFMPSGNQKKEDTERGGGRVELKGEKGKRTPATNSRADKTANGGQEGLTKNYKKMDLRRLPKEKTGCGKE